jgi:uncharacterized protein YcfJ
MSDKARTPDSTDPAATPGVHRDADGRVQPDSADERVEPVDRDTDERDDTVSGTATGTVVGAGIGAVIGGPVGAVIGAVVGAAGGKAAEEANREDPNVPTGNPTDADSHRARNDYYSGQIYEEGSLADVPRKQARDEQSEVDPVQQRADKTPNREEGPEAY